MNRNVSANESVIKKIALSICTRTRESETEFYDDRPHVTTEVTYTRMSRTHIFILPMLLFVNLSPYSEQNHLYRNTKKNELCSRSLSIIFVSFDHY